LRIKRTFSKAETEDPIIKLTLSWLHYVKAVGFLRLGLGRIYACGQDEAIALWDVQTGDRIKVLRAPRPYEKMNITGIMSLTEAQKATLKALGAVENLA
jgi:hypothetical protein